MAGTEETLPESGGAPVLGRLPARDPIEAHNAVDAIAARMFGTVTQPLRIGRFVLLGKLGDGGMGVVYAAYDEELDRRVALKLLHDDPSGPRGDDRRLIREARAAARLVHPNVVAIHEVGTWNEQVYLAMEYVDGWTLRGWLAEHEPRWNEVIEMFVQAGRGLAAAHAAGVVHRDFKPENVLIGRDGIARVADFGLARAGQRADPETSVSGERPRTMPDDAVTRTGAVMGTPAYMAPEQHTGGTVDARTDQFAFCVALWEALYGRRPFAGDSMVAIATAVLSGTIGEPPADTSVPPRVRRVLRRGLGRERDDRHPSMTELLVELQRDPARQRRTIAVAGLGACVLVGVGLALPRPGTAPSPCEGGNLRVGTVWGEPQRARLEAAFTATLRPWAGAAAQSVITRLDRQASAWATMHREACEASRVRGEQSDALLDLRMACLDRRLAELGSLAELLQDADAAVVTSAERSVAGLVEIEACADTEALRSATPVPDDPTARAQIAAVADAVIRGGQLRDLGRYDAAIEVGTAMRAEAQSLGHAPTLADAEVLLGASKALAGDFAEAEAILESATWSAIAGRHRSAQASATTALVSLTGYTLGNHDAARRWAEHARAVLAAMGDPPLQLAALEGNVGNLAMASGDRVRGVAHFREAMRLFEVALGPDDARVGRMAANLAVALRQTGELDEALASYDHALSVLTTALGPGHPDLGPVLSNAGALLYFRGRVPDALARYRQALAIGEASVSANHPQLGHAHNNIAEALLDLGDADGADTHARAAIAIWDASLGPTHALLAHPLTVLGRALVARGRAAEAVTVLERALTLRTASESTASERATTRFALAEAVWGAGDGARARQLAVFAQEEAEPTADPVAGPTPLASNIATWLEQHPLPA